MKNELLWQSLFVLAVFIAFALGWNCAEKQETQVYQPTYKFEVPKLRLYI